MQAAWNSASGPGYGASAAEWQTARLGLGLYAVAVCAQLLCVLMMLVISWLAMREFSSQSTPARSLPQGRFQTQPPFGTGIGSTGASWLDRTAATVCNVVAMSAGGASIVCGLFGLACLCITPTQFPGRILAILAEGATAVVLVFILTGVTSAAMFAGRYSDESPYQMQFAFARSGATLAVGGLVCGVLLVVYLYSLGIWFGSQKLIKEVWTFGLFNIVLIVVTPIVVSIGGLLAPLLGDILMLLAVITGATLAIVMQLWLAKILFIARSIIPYAPVGSVGDVYRHPDIVTPELAEVVPILATPQAAPIQSHAIPAAAPLTPTWPPGFAPPTTPLPATAPKTAVRPKPPTSAPPPPKHPLD